MPPTPARPACCSSARVRVMVRGRHAPTHPSLPPPTRPLPPTRPWCTTEAQVYCVDLLALVGCEAELAAALRPVLASERVYKLGG